MQAVAQAADLSNGERVRVWWADERCWYLAKVIDSRVDQGFHGLARLHRLRYEMDKMERWHELRREHWTRVPKKRQTSRGRISVAEVTKALQANYEAPLSEGDGRSEATMSEAEGDDMSETGGEEASSESELVLLSGEESASYEGSGVD